MSKLAAASARQGKEESMNMSEYKIDYCHHDSLTAQNTYIKREDVIDAIQLTPVMRKDRSLQRTDQIINSIKAIPAADVEPVRHGHWLCSDDLYETAICSECNCDTQEPYGFVIKSDEYNFCRNCGAKMDGGDNNET